MAAVTERWKMPLYVQLALPLPYRGNRDADLIFSTLSLLGFSGVELNIADPWSTDLDDVLDYLRGYGLTMLNFASGLTAKTLGLSLSAEDETARSRAVSRCRDLLELFEGKTSGIILGFIKGPASPNQAAARASFRRSLEELEAEAARTRVGLVVEATNRYESSVANSLADTVELVDGLSETAVCVLPDTFHMNIEEADSLAALSAYRGRYRSVHISDNNRLFPGFGAIDFERIIEHLAAIGFAGPVAIEGNLKGRFADDINACAAYLDQFFASGRKLHGQ